MPYTVNSRALTGEKPCINKGFLGLLTHRKLTFNMIVPGPLKLLRLTPFNHVNCHSTINWWCNRPIKIDPLKNCSGRVLNSVFFWVRVRYSTHHAREPLVRQRGLRLMPITTLLSINTSSHLCIYVIVAGPRSAIGWHLTRKSGVLGSIPGLATYFRFTFRFFKKGSCQLLAKVCARSTG